LTARVRVAEVPRVAVQFGMRYRAARHSWIVRGWIVFSESSAQPDILIRGLPVHLLYSDFALDWTVRQAGIIPIRKPHEEISELPTLVPKRILAVIRLTNTSLFFLAHLYCR
jgi:hypothetical protein